MAVNLNPTFINSLKDSWDELYKLKELITREPEYAGIVIQVLHKLATAIQETQLHTIPPRLITLVQEQKISQEIANLIATVTFIYDGADFAQVDASPDEKVVIRDALGLRGRNQLDQFFKEGL